MTTMMIHYSSEASPFPQLPLEEDTSSGVVAISPKEQQQRGRRRLLPPPPPPPLLQSSEATLEDEDAWMHEWVKGGTSIPVQESRDDDGGEIHVPSFHSVECTYLPKCSWLEQGYSSAGSKILFAGWLVYIPAGETCTEKLPSRRDVVYLMMFRDLPKIYLARDDSNIDDDDSMFHARHEFHSFPFPNDMDKESCSRTMESTLVLFFPFLLRPTCLTSILLLATRNFNNWLIQLLLHFKSIQYKSHTLDWHDVEHHQEYAPTAQLEAAMHLMFVMDSWMTKMLVR